jgi:hypothetical protein
MACSREHGNELSSSQRILGNSLSDWLTASEEEVCSVWSLMGRIGLRNIALITFKLSYGDPEV